MNFFGTSTQGSIIEVGFEKVGISKDLTKSFLTCVSFFSYASSIKNLGKSYFVDGLNDAIKNAGFGLNTIDAGKNVNDAATYQGYEKKEDKVKSDDKSE